MADPSHCSFCGQTRGDVRFLLRGPGDVAICGECIALAVREMVEGKGLIDAETFANAPILEVSPFAGYGAPASLSGGEFVDLLKPGEEDDK